MLGSRTRFNVRKRVSATGFFLSKWKNYCVEELLDMISDQMGMYEVIVSTTCEYQPLGFDLPSQAVKGIPPHE